MVVLSSLGFLGGVGLFAPAMGNAAGNYADFFRFNFYPGLFLEPNFSSYIWQRPAGQSHLVVGFRADL